MKFITWHRFVRVHNTRFCIGGHILSDRWVYTYCFLIGGLDVRAQEASLRLHPDIVIATPGRLIDLLHNAPSFTLANVEILVLDEADRYE